MPELSSTLIPNFNQLDPSLLRNPKYANAIDKTFLASEATCIHKWLIRIIKSLHIPRVQIAVDRDFCFNHYWITSDQYRDLYHAIYPNKGSKASSSDVPMSDTSGQHFISHSVASSSSRSPADGVSALLN